MLPFGQAAPFSLSMQMKWYRRAAARSYANAQFSLGFRYEMGLRVPKDDSEAVKWYCRAAEHGHGVAQDFIQAHKWYNLAASRFSLLASRFIASQQDLRDKSVRNRNRVATRLSPTEIAEAQHLAWEWRPTRLLEFDFSTCRNPPLPTDPTAACVSSISRASSANSGTTLGRPTASSARGPARQSGRSKPTLACRSPAGYPNGSSPRFQRPLPRYACAMAQASASPSVLERESTGWLPGQCTHMVRGCTEVRIPQVGCGPGGGARTKPTSLCCFVATWWPAYRASSRPVSGRKLQDQRVATPYRCPGLLRGVGDGGGIRSILPKWRQGPPESLRGFPGRGDRRAAHVTALGLGCRRLRRRERRGNGRTDRPDVRARGPLRALHSRKACTSQ